MKPRITQITVTPDRIFDDRAFTITIDDDAAGEYVAVHQLSEGLIKIDPAEWPALRRAINKMIRQCADE